ncbi:MAG: protein kinase, partial [Planctomycetales bacterium]|nr:protein kinase [Planctomycetales bacterium]
MECLSDRALRRFAAGSLSEPRQRDTAEHLEQCEHCARRVEKLFLGDEPTHAFRVAPHRAETGDAVMGETEPALADLRLRLYELVGSPADCGQVGDSHAKRASSRPHQRDDSPQPPRLSRFKIDRRLGSGGFGDVFLAYDELLKRNVAIKLPRTASLADHDLMERFLREGKAAAQLHHPNIIPVYEAG